MSFSSSADDDNTPAIKNTTGFIPHIIGFDNWPSASIKYNFKSIDSTPQLQVVFGFNVDRYDRSTEIPDGDETLIPQWKQNAIDDLTTYKNIRNQLKWTYSPDDEKPDEKVPVITFSVSTSVTPADTYAFNDMHILTFVNSLINWLQKFIDTPVFSIPLKRPASKTVSVPLTANVNSKNIFQVEVILSTIRTSTDDDTSRVSVSAAILPDTGSSFVLKFENIFKGLDHQLKLTTVASQSAGNINQLWAVRLATTNKGKGIFYSVVEGTGVTLAPAPLSTKLLSNDLPIRPYKTGAGIDWNMPPEQKSFNGVDIDTWTKVFLQGVDDLFIPANIGPLFTCMALYKLQDSDNTDPLSDISETKTHITTELIKQLNPVIKGQTANLADAREHLARQLNDQLSNFYSTSAVLQYKVSAATDGDTGALKLSGNVRAVTADNKILKGVKASNTTIRLITNTDDQPQSLLSFGISLENPGRQTHFSLGSTFVLTQIDYTPADGPNITLNLLKPEASTIFKTDMPVVIRECPTLPAFRSQTAEKTFTDDNVAIPATILWDYFYEYTQKDVAQDMISSQLVINESATSVSTAFGDLNKYFENLAQFITVYPAIKTDLDKALPKLNATTTTDSDEYKIAISALIALSQLAVNVKNVLTADQQVPVAAGLNNGYNFTISETTVNATGDNRLLVNVSAENVTGKRIQVPEIMIQGYATEPVERSNNAGNEKSYTFSANGLPLTFAHAFSQRTPRTVKVTSLNALEVQSMRTLNGIWRNKNLLPTDTGRFFETDERFVYHVPATASTSKIVPALNWTSIDLDLSELNTTGNKLSVGDYLKLFFGTIIKGVEDVTYMVRLQADYQYNIDESGFLPPVTMPITLVPSIDLNTSDPTEQNYLADNITMTIKQWRESVELNGYGQRYKFVVSIFATPDTTTTPLYHTDGLFINLKNVS